MQQLNSIESPSTDFVRLARSAVTYPEMFKRASKEMILKIKSQSLEEFASSIAVYETTLKKMSSIYSSLDDQHNENCQYFSWGILNECNCTYLKQISKAFQQAIEFFDHKKGEMKSPDFESLMGLTPELFPAKP